MPWAISQAYFEKVYGSKKNVPQDLAALVKELRAAADGQADEVSPRLEDSIVALERYVKEGATGSNR